MYLNCHSYHSLRYGTLSVEALVRSASELGLETLCLTDINTVTAMYEFYKLCKEANIKPVVGVEIRQDNELLYITLAKDATGIGEINRMLTAFNCDNIPLPKTNPVFKNVITIYPIENIPETFLENEYIGIRSEQLNLLYRAEWKKLIPKMVVLQPVTFKTKREYNLHRVLRGIALNTLGTKLKAYECCKKDEVLRPLHELLNHYQQYPQITVNTQNVLDQCSFEFEFSTPRNKKYYTGSKEGDLKLITRLAYQGLAERYGANDEVAKKRVEKELKVIDELNFCGYFLITWDIVQYSNSMGFMHIGRGSGANSIISYCLGITNICPIELDLYFERFLNLNRKTPPDFDIDWSWQDRDTILEYIFKKYGKEYVAFCGTNVEFKYRSIFREVGKVFGLPKEELDVLAKQPEEKHDKNSVVRQVYKYGKMLEKFPNQRSMHACGILISEEPITNYSALEMPPKGFPIVQFDMHTAEDIGLEKFDILSQRGIGTINDAVKLIKKNKGIDVDIRNNHLSKDEDQCNKILSQ
jgi:error-prone DNA polymerase